MIDEEEILANEPIRVDSRGPISKGIYNSKSADVLANNGLRGKLTEAELEERTTMHAKRRVTGKPTVAAIIDLWRKRGKTMSANSEYKWAEQNQKRIDAEIARLEDNGEMPVIAVPDSTITSHLAQGARNLLDIIRTNKRAGQKVLAEIEGMTDTFVFIEARDRENYLSSKDDTREEYNKRIQTLIELKNSHLAVFKEISRSSSDQGRVLVEMMKTVSEINKGGQAFDKTLDKRINDAIKEKGLKIQQQRDLEDQDPLAPVSDDERII